MALHGCWFDYVHSPGLLLVSSFANKEWTVDNQVKLDHCIILAHNNTVI